MPLNEVVVRSMALKAIEVVVIKDMKVPGTVQDAGPNTRFLLRQNFLYGRFFNIGRSFFQHSRHGANES